MPLHPPKLKRVHVFPLLIQSVRCAISYRHIRLFIQRTASKS
jgi:hypothetical protein